jgi:hypothetical protein
MARQASVLTAAALSLVLVGIAASALAKDADLRSTITRVTLSLAAVGAAYSFFIIRGNLDSYDEKIISSLRLELSDIYLQLPREKRHELLALMYFLSLEGHHPVRLERFIKQSGLPEDDAIMILTELARRGVVDIRVGAAESNYVALSDASLAKYLTRDKLAASGVSSDLEASSPSEAI